LALLAAGLGLRAWLMPEPRAVDGDSASPPTRMVSMSPSITETLFALGVDERIAGVTRDCAYPAAARAAPEVGGCLDPSYERILGLEADLVLLLPYHGEVRDRLAGLGIRTLTVDHESVPAILDSFEILGRACGEPEAGRALRARVESELEAVRARVA